MFKDKTIETRVLSVIKKKIADGQKKYEDTIVKIDKDTKEEIKSITAKAESAKVAAADKVVNDILGKII